MSFFWRVRFDLSFKFTALVYFIDRIFSIVYLIHHILSCHDSRVCKNKYCHGLQERVCEAKTNLIETPAVISQNSWLASSLRIDSKFHLFSFNK